MRLKIRCYGECEKFCKIFWEVNKALVYRGKKIKHGIGTISPEENLQLRHLIDHRIYFNNKIYLKI